MGKMLTTHLMLLIQKARENQRLYLSIMHCKNFTSEKKHKFEWEVEIEDSNLSSWTRMPNIVANIEIKYRQNTSKGQRKEEVWKGLHLILRRKYEEKKRKDSERKRLAKKRKLEQIDQPSPAPTREETIPPIPSFKHKATIHHYLRRAYNAFSSSPHKNKYSVWIQLNEPKKSGGKPITLNNEEKEWIISFIFVLHAFS